MENETIGKGNPQPQGASFRFISQYVKDLSFESPRSPQIFQNMNHNFRMEANLNVSAKAVAENIFEVVLEISAKSRNDDGEAFLVELKHAGLFAIEGLEKDTLQLILLIECPTHIFPFARRVISDATTSGGFAPLLLDPVDFRSLYESRMKNMAA